MIVGMYKDEDLDVAGLQLGYICFSRNVLRITASIMIALILASAATAFDVHA